MKNSKLLAISSTITILGLFSLLLILDIQTLPELKINEINKEHLETQVKVTANIQSIKETPGLYILTLQDSTGKIKAIIFKEDFLNLQKNSQIIIEGEIQEYQGELELIAEKIIQ